nr:S24 family peptidase [uncultured Moraxella sp.]
MSDDFFQRLVKITGTDNQAEIARTLEIPKTTLSNWLKRGVSKSGALLIAEKYHVGIDYVLTGKGEMMVPVLSAIPLVADVNEKDNRIAIPFYDVKFSCGSGENAEVEFDTGKVIKFEPSFFTNRHLNPANCRMIRASGNSMQYYICDNDAVMIDTSATQPLENEVYAIYFENERMIRRIIKQTGGKLCLRADNPAFSDKIVNIENSENFGIIGRVVYRSG